MPRSRCIALVEWLKTFGHVESSNYIQNHRFNLNRFGVAEYNHDGRIYVFNLSTVRTTGWVISVSQGKSKKQNSGPTTLCGLFDIQQFK